MLLAPLALLLSALAVPIILMYVLKLRRQEFVVPSNFLWKQALDDVQANAPWQRLRFNILLLLQLLTLAALVIGLAQPAYSRSHVVGGDLVVIVDESYGMQARDVTPSRFSVAQARARTLQSELAGAGVMSIIGMSAHPHLALAASSDGGAIRRAIDGLHAGVDAPDFQEALSLAASLARAGQSTRVVVLTSRDSGISALPLRVGFPVDIERIGGTLHDLGITSFSASSGTKAVQAVARVSNFGTSPARSDVDLFVDGKLADVRPIAVAGRNEQNLFWTNIPPTAHRLQLRIAVADNVVTDKQAWAVVATEPPRRVLLVSKGDFFLEAALAADPAIQVSVVAPTTYSAALARNYDLTILDAFLPASAPTGSVLVVAPPAGHLDSMRFTRTIGAGTVQAASNSSLSGVLRYVELGDVHIARVRSAHLPAWMQTVATTDGRIALAAGESGTIRLALVSFDLQQSDWPLRVSFPVMLQNVIHYLAPGIALGRTTVTTGEAVPLFPPPRTTRLDILRPDGTLDHLKPPFPPFTDSSQPGIYTVQAVSSFGSTAAGHATSFAVNFFPSRPAPAGGPAIVHVGRVQTGQSLTTSVPISVIWIFEAAALAFLAVEWWIAFRGTRLR